ncbi:MAG TPA: hypothetical protein VI248_03905 [Kineosporiaceae bacterium]
MPSTDSNTSPTPTGSGGQARRARYAAWAHLLDSILPAPDENRLVPVAEVGRASLPFVEESLADVGLRAVVSESRTATGVSRFRVLVPARDADLAEEIVAGF